MWNYAYPSVVNAPFSTEIHQLPEIQKHPNIDKKKTSLYYPFFLYIEIQKKETILNELKTDFFSSQKNSKNCAFIERRRKYFFLRFF